MLTIHDGKGKKDRTLPLPESISDALQNQVNYVIELHEADLKGGSSGVFMPGRLEEKYKNASRELIWQWFFPAKTLTFVPGGIKIVGYGVIPAGPGAGAILGDPGGRGDLWEVNKTTWRFTKNEHFGYRV